MQTLPLELIDIIITYISKITDKRQFAQTCKTHNNLIKPLIQNQESMLKIKYFEYPIDYCVEKFTLELCNDSYFNKISELYLNPQNDIIVKALTIYRQIELLELAMENGCELFKQIDDYDNYVDYLENNNSCAHAVISGNIEMLIFVRLHGCQWDSNIFLLAARCNHLHMLKFLEKYGCEEDDIATLFCAINGNIEMMNWLIENDFEINIECCQTAAYHGHLDMLKLLKNSDCYWDDYACQFSANNGQLECLEWLIDNGCPLNVSNVYYFSANNNHVHIIKWMRSKGYLWDKEICVGAIEGNHLELLKWLIKEGCKLDINIYNAAIKNKNLGIIQLLKDNGCPTH